MLAHAQRLKSLLCQSSDNQKACISHVTSAMKAIAALCEQSVAVACIAVNVDQALSGHASQEVESQQMLEHVCTSEDSLDAVLQDGERDQLEQGVHRHYQVWVVVVKDSCNMPPCRHSCHLEEGHVHEAWLLSVVAKTP